MRVINAAGDITANAQNVATPDDVTECDVFISGTWVGTLEIQIQDTAGNWLTEQDKGTITANGRFVIAMALPHKVRVLSTAWTSGTATIRIDGVASRV